MTCAYINALNRGLEGEASTQSAQPDLRARLEAWYSILPEISRNRAFAMAEMEQALATQGKYLSPILLRLGWQRKRKWSGKGQYSRFWLPPRCGGSPL